MNDKPPRLVMCRAPRINKGGGKRDDRGPKEKSLQRQSVETRIKTMLANEESQNEESQDLGQTMTADKLPHPLNSPLTKERVHLGICLSITKP